MKVSCVLASYNRPNFVRQAIKSVSDQTHRNFELLVFDDSTIFDIHRVVAEFSLPAVRIFHNEVSVTQRGSVCRLGINCNAGLAIAEGDLVCFLCDDDYYFPGWFEAASRFFSDPENARKNVAFGHLVYSTSKSMEFSEHLPGLRHLEPIKNPLCLLDHNMVVHRRFEPAFRWPEEWGHSGAADAVYFDRLARTGHLFYPIKSYAVVKRIHQKNMQATLSEIGTNSGEGIRE